jgi:murein DD-endopeptidase MepM/ murein hydrolase activator NlpD
MPTPLHRGFLPLAASASLACLAGLSVPSAASARSFGPFTPREDLFWPLCGRITEDPPIGWVETDGCPESRRGALSSDQPVRSTFGPRPLASEDYRYDFHRGIDISTPIGTPTFAIADGKVMIAGEHSAYDEPVIVVRHFRPGYTSCSGSAGGCYHAMYIHSRDLVDGPCCAVAAGDQVVAGQLLGWSGVSDSGYEHLHFEIRDAPAADPFSYWMRDCIHPLSVLGYDPEEPTSGAAPGVVLLDGTGVACQDDGQPCNVTVVVDTARRDVRGVQLSLEDTQGVAVVVPGDTADGRGYNVLPARFLFDEANFQWSHKDSTGVPWETFQLGGAQECPYHEQHEGGDYDANYHMDRCDTVAARLAR